MYKCVRCNDSIQEPIHPMAHMSSICYKCRAESPETITDQNNFNCEYYKKIKDYLDATR